MLSQVHSGESLLSSAQDGMDGFSTTRTSSMSMYMSTGLPNSGAICGESGTPRLNKESLRTKFENDSLSCLFIFNICHGS